MQDNPTVETILRKALADRGVTLACPICRGQEWQSRDLLDLPFNQGLPEQPLIVASAVCRQCGHVSLHDLTYLKTGR